jgi:hypothetical protein
MEDSAPYNPLSKRNLASSIVSKLLGKPVDELPPPSFSGAGIYLIYYTGGYHPYARISEANAGERFAQPIYIGKAIPAGGRKGMEGFDVPVGIALSKRLSEHAESIASAVNLEVKDFRCRWLVVDEVFIPLAESLLISHFKPLWNVIVEGFGNHNPGKGRTKGKKPSWDVVHPGRPWARRLKPAQTPDEVLASIKSHIESCPIPPPPLHL